MSAFRGDFPPCTSQQTLCKQHQLEVIRARQAAWMKQRAEALEDSVTTTTVPSSVSVRSSSRSEQPPLNDVVVPQKAHPPPLLEDERVGLDSSKLPLRSNATNELLAEEMGVSVEDTLERLVETVLLDSKVVVRLPLLLLLIHVPDTFAHRDESRARRRSGRPETQTRA